MRRETLAARAAHQVDPATGAVTAPVHLSTTFERAPDGGYPLGYTYARAGNPNRALLEDRLAALEGGQARPASRPAWPPRGPCSTPWPRATT